MRGGRISVRKFSLLSMCEDDDLNQCNDRGGGLSQSTNNN